jgi:hypothetical protein
MDPEKGNRYRLLRACGLVEDVWENGHDLLVTVAIEKALVCYKPFLPTRRHESGLLGLSILQLQYPERRRTTDLQKRQRFNARTVLGGSKMSVHPQRWTWNERVYPFLAPEILPRTSRNMILEI